MSGGNLDLLGVNLAGGEFGAVGQAYGTGYTYPTHAEIDYEAASGMNVIRLPFLWERLQPTLGGPLDPAELARIDDVINYATSKGMKVDLDLHNYGTYGGQLVGSGAVPNSAFAYFWGQIAAHYATNGNVMFGLMNEPQQSSASGWLGSVNAAVAAIRGAGASQEILVPGIGYDGAWTWTTGPNASVIGSGVVDPLNNYAFEVHQYLDSDGSGTHPNVVSSTVGSQRLAAITSWAESTGHRLFLGEFGTASDATSLSALGDMLSTMSQHADVWQGGTYWAAGPWWGNYMYSAEPSNGVDTGQMKVLEEYEHRTPTVGSPASVASMSGGTGPAPRSSAPTTATPAAGSAAAANLTTAPAAGATPATTTAPAASTLTTSTLTTSTPAAPAPAAPLSSAPAPVSAVPATPVATHPATSSATADPTARPAGATTPAPAATTTAAPASVMPATPMAVKPATSTATANPAALLAATTPAPVSAVPATPMATAPTTSAATAEPVPAPAAATPVAAATSDAPTTPAPVSVAAASTPTASPSAAAVVVPPTPVPTFDTLLAIPAAAPAQAPAVTIDPGVTFTSPTDVTLTGTMSGTAASVHVLAGRRDLGAATVAADGTWALPVTLRAGFHDGIAAVATSGDGLSGQAAAPFSLTTGVKGQAYKASLDSYDDSGTYLGTTQYDGHGNIYLQWTETANADGGVTDSYIAGSALPALGVSSMRTRYDANGDIVSETLDVLAGGAHTLAGAGGNDTFVFQPHAGQDNIAGFVTSGPSHDVLSLPASEFTSFAQLLSDVSQSGGDTVIKIAGHNTITLLGVSASALTRQDIRFHP